MAGKNRTYRFIALAIGIFAFISSARAQNSFPWGDFKQRTLEELVKINLDEDASELAKYPDRNRLLFHNEILPSVVQLTFTGQSRPIGTERKKFIELWSSSYGQGPSYADLFEVEYLFKEGSVEYWLPVQAPVAKYFPKELQKDDLVDIYLIRPGALRNKNAIDWIFLVEEFQKPKK